MVICTIINFNFIKIRCHRIFWQTLVLTSNNAEPSDMIYFINPKQVILFYASHEEVETHGKLRLLFDAEVGVDFCFKKM